MFLSLLLQESIALAERVRQVDEALSLDKSYLQKASMKSSKYTLEIDS